MLFLLALIFLFVLILQWNNIWLYILKCKTELYSTKYPESYVDAYLVKEVVRKSYFNGDSWKYRPYALYQYTVGTKSYKGKLYLHPKKRTPSKCLVRYRKNNPKKYVCICKYT